MPRSWGRIEASVCAEAEEAFIRVVQNADLMLQKVKFARVGASLPQIFWALKEKA
jgi:hypothetical protein